MIPGPRNIIETYLKINLILLGLEYQRNQVVNRKISEKNMKERISWGWGDPSPNLI